MLNPPLGLTVFRGFPLVAPELASRRVLPLMPLQCVASRVDETWTRSKERLTCHHCVSSTPNVAAILLTLLTASRFREKMFRSQDRPALRLTSNDRESHPCLRTLDSTRAPSALLVRPGCSPSRRRIASDAFRLLPVALSCLDPDQVGALHSLAGNVRVGAIPGSGALACYALQNRGRSLSRCPPSRRASARSIGLPLSPSCGLNLSASSS